MEAAIEVGTGVIYAEVALEEVEVVGDAGLHARIVPMAALHITGLHVDGHAEPGFAECQSVLLCGCPLAHHDLVRRWPSCERLADGLGRSHPVPDCCLPCDGFVIGQQIRVVQQVQLQGLPSWPIVVVPAIKLSNHRILY